MKHFAVSSSMHIGEEWERNRSIIGWVSFSSIHVFVIRSQLIQWTIEMSVLFLYDSHKWNSIIDRFVRVLLGVFPLFDDPNVVYNSIALPRRPSRCGITVMYTECLWHLLERIPRIFRKMLRLELRYIKIIEAFLELKGKRSHALIIIYIIWWRIYVSFIKIFII
jgi:hypothetical protein